MQGACLGMANVEIPIGLRRKACDHASTRDTQVLCQFLS